MDGFPGNELGVGDQLHSVGASGRDPPKSFTKLKPKPGSGTKKTNIKAPKPKRSVTWSPASFLKYEESLAKLGAEHAATNMAAYSEEFKDSPQPGLSMRAGSSEPRIHPAASEHSRRLATFGISLTNTLSDVVIVYPCLVLRRQCQVNNVGQRYHYTPFTIMGVAFNLQRSQGFTCLWKGVGSYLMVNALTFGVESGLSESTKKLPKEVDRHSKLKDIAGHVLLKALSAGLVMPFYSAHLVESIQSEAASETPGIFYFITEGFSRLFGFAGVQSRRMLPFRHLLLPTVLYFLLRYILTNLLQFSILSGFRLREKRKHDQALNSAHPFSPVDTAYMSVPSTSRQAVNQVPLTTTISTSRHATTQYHQLLSNFIAQVITDVLLYPFETIIFRLHVQGTRTIIDDMDRGSGFLPVSSRYEGCLDCLSTVVTYEGKGGLYRGFGALMLQHLLKFSILKIIHLSLQLSSPTI
uniref:solute carrier family 25 member 46-like n=1 Tax=Styela clava TaxID=7725 RepID=UPI0019396CCF|nr:solute carrier family 25 member 46-like [Styela clava]